MKRKVKLVKWRLIREANLKVKPDDQRGFVRSYVYIFLGGGMSKVSKRSLNLNILHSRFPHGEATEFNFHIL